MQYTKISKSEMIERVITDILYADMEGGNVGFIKLAYEKLRLHDGKRIMKMRKKNNKISLNIANAVYEDIIGIIVEEICRRGNKGLYDELVAYYLERFPYVREKFEDKEDNAYAWEEIYDASFNQSNSEIVVFLHKSFVLLYCITYGRKEAVKSFLDMCKEAEWLDNHYKDGKLLFYDRQKIRISSVLQMFEDCDGLDISEYDSLSDRLIKEQRELMADYFQIEPEEIEEFVLDHILCNMHGIYGDGNELIDMKFEGIQDELNDICKKYHITQLEFWDASKRQYYIEMIKKIYRKWCKRENRNLISGGNEDGDSLVIYGYTSPFEHGDAERCLSELMTLFWFENYAINQQKFLDEYYENFSFDSHGKDYEELRKANASLTEELSQCKKKLQKYVDAESERKRIENKEAKKADRQLTEKIALLEKKLEEYEKEMAHQTEMLANRDTYISLLETENIPEDSVEDVDISKIYSRKILFVGGMPEMISRLKAVFSTAMFVSNETDPLPKKTDLIVLLAGHMKQAMFYKYIGLAREKDIKVTCCNGSNIESITTQVASCL